MKRDLEQELRQRGTAEVSEDGTVTQVTQALSETKNEVTLLVFGELKKIKIRSIEEVCPCAMAKHFKTKEDCQSSQREDAKARGFLQVICPEQFID